MRNIALESRSLRVVIALVLVPGLLVGCGDGGASVDTRDGLDPADVVDVADVSDVADTSDAPDVPDAAEVFDPSTLIGELEATLLAVPEAERPAVLEAWLEAQARLPITVETSAIFVMQGAAQEVKMVGDATNWNAQVSPRLTRLDVAGVDLWWLAQTYEPDARLDYKLVVNGSDWRLDPLNPRTMAGGFGPNSELAMPAYVTPPEVADLTGPLGGTTTSHVIASEALGEDRTIYVYVPKGAESATSRRLVIFHDGNDYRNLIRAPLILDRLVQSGDIPPLVAVFAQPRQRALEYNRNDAYVSHLADELVPFMRQTYDAGHSPALTGTIGPSFGGLIACYAAITRPEVFGLAGCQSGAHSYDGDAMIELVKERPKVDVKLHLIVGTYELAVSGSTSEGNLLEAQRRLVSALSDKGYTFAAGEHPQGHSWGLWRDLLPAALRYLYGE